MAQHIFMYIYFYVHTPVPERNGLQWRIGHGAVLRYLPLTLCRGKKYMAVDVKWVLFAQSSEYIRGYYGGYITSRQWFSLSSHTWTLVLQLPEIIILLLYWVLTPVSLEATNNSFKATTKSHVQQNRAGICHTIHRLPLSLIGDFVVRAAVHIEAILQELDFPSTNG